MKVNYREYYYKYKALKYYLKNNQILHGGVDVQNDKNMINIITTGIFYKEENSENFLLPLFKIILENHIDEFLKLGATLINISHYDPNQNEETKEWIIKNLTRLDVDDKSINIKNNFNNESYFIPEFLFVLVKEEYRIKEINKITDTDIIFDFADVFGKFWKSYYDYLKKKNIIRFTYNPNNNILFKNTKFFIFDDSDNTKIKTLTKKLMNDDHFKNLFIYDYYCNYKDPYEMVYRYIQRNLKKNKVMFEDVLEEVDSNDLKRMEPFYAALHNSLFNYSFEYWITTNF